MEKMASDGPKKGQDDFFPTNPDLADILGRTDLNFEISFIVFGPHISAKLRKFLRSIRRLDLGEVLGC